MWLNEQSITNALSTYGNRNYALAKIKIISLLGVESA